ncbi:L-dopachrome tautomerase-related protein [Elizabethkingia anophelis]|uniref:Major royal jelly protein n=1 Tax=Elizabethkingia anophelis TaxID=1117645 RepID=A0AAU8V4P7_9FLAO|nr:L-dopachrome tautomerase-related protein [Elizabethkingia anophelis]AQX03587.1 hypothetical protein BBD32_12500 [Elizabethkingia anophelis]OPB60869.1 hypothetical protein BAY11_17755 [Elizabethkingia anophelis]
MSLKKILFKNNIYIRLFIFLMFELLLQSCETERYAKQGVSFVASVKGVQITTIGITKKGRVFVNAPRWRNGVPFSVAEIVNGRFIPYPNQAMNSWEIGNTINDMKFIAVQAVYAKGDFLYVVDTANPMFTGTIISPRVFVFNTLTNTLVKTYKLPDTVYTNNSYINDIRVDEGNRRIYMTDSGVPGLIVINLDTDESIRLLHEHAWTTAETNFLTIKGKKWERTVHSDGIALNKNADTLFIHALTGYTLYGIPTAVLIKPSLLPTVKPLAIRTAAVDGMIMDDRGYLYYGDLENRIIQYLEPNRKIIRTLVNNSSVVNWPDGFALHKKFLYYVNSRIQDTALGQDVDDYEFTIYKVPVP